MSLVRLACPDCGRDLHAPSGAVLFACAACRRACQLAGGRLVNVPWRAVAPRLPAPDGALALLPFWVFAVAWRGPGVPPLPPLPRCAVPALCPDNGAAFLKLGRALSLHREPWPAWPGSARPACGGHLDAAEAAALAPTVALACLDGAARRRLLEDADAAWPPSLGAPDLVFLPFARLGRRLRDLVAGCEASDRLLDGFAWEDTLVEPPMETVPAPAPPAASPASPAVPAPSAAAPPPSLTPA